MYGGIILYKNPFALETGFGWEKGRLLKMGYRQTHTSGAETTDTEKRKNCVNQLFNIIEVWEVYLNSKEANIISDIL